MSETNKSVDTKREYDDMLEMPHHVSHVHPRMEIRNRAAQFAPFAALSGYGDAVDETARITEKRVELDENHKEIMDKKMQILDEHIEEHPEVTIRYFHADAYKAGGEYLTATGKVKKLDNYQKIMMFEDGSKYAVYDIVGMESELF